MVVFKGLRKYSVTIFLVILCASASLAAANDLSLNAHAQTMNPVNEPPLQISGELNSECVTDYFNNFRTMITAPEHPDMPVTSMNESFEETVAITLHKDDDKIIWSLAPSLRKFSLDPIEDINNLQLVLKYRF